MTQSANSQIPVGKLLASVLAGMIVLQAATKFFQLSPKWKSPGPVRGDLAFEESLLADASDQWLLQSFTPPEITEEGQYWWSHIWRFASESDLAIVAFDQAGWVGWHELSQCYTSAGWTLKSRKIEQHESWNYVISKFSRANGEAAVLFFSMCYVDDEPIEPWRLTLRESGRHRQSFSDLLLERNRHRRDRVGVPAIQCQLFLPAIHPITPDVIHNCRELHLATRERLRLEASLRSSAS